MTTYSKETALYNTGAIGDDIQEAGTTATNYLTDISSDGVFVHMYDPNSPDGTGATDNGVKITDQIDIIRDGISVANYGEGVRIGQTKSGYSSIVIDPVYDDDEEISDILKIKTANDVYAQKIILDSNNTGSIRCFKTYYEDYNLLNIYYIDQSKADYYIGGIGSADDPLTTSVRYVSNTFTINDISNIPEGKSFSLDISFQAQNNKNSGRNTVLTGARFSFTKASTGNVQTITKNDNISSSDYSDFITGASIINTIEASYNPTNNNITVVLGSKLNETPSGNIKYWIGGSVILYMNYELNDVKIPINQFNGDVYTCNIIDANGSYSSKGNFYIGLNGLDDSTLGNKLSNYYMVSPLPVVKNNSLDVKKFLIDVLTEMLKIKSLNTKASKLFYIETISPSGYNFTANQYRSLTSTNIPSHHGYTPLIVEAKCINKSALHVFNYSLIHDNGTLSYEVINRTSSAVNDANFSFKILYIYNDFIG